jgi:Lipid A 3-O-deacylase (PagL)
MITKLLLAAALSGVASVVLAGPYVELGTGVYVGSSDSCIADYDRNNKMGCSDNPLGMVAIGYQYKGFSVQAEHTSSLVEKDKGLNIISIKYRHEFWKD